MIGKGGAGPRAIREIAERLAKLEASDKTKREESRQTSATTSSWRPIPVVLGASPKDTVHHLEQH